MSVSVIILELKSVVKSNKRESLMQTVDYSWKQDFALKAFLRTWPYFPGRPVSCSDSGNM